MILLKRHSQLEFQKSQVELQTTKNDKILSNALEIKNNHPKLAIKVREC